MKKQEKRFIKHDDMIIYLQDRSYYEKRYDEQTIEDCLSISDRYKSLKKSPDEKKRRCTKCAYLLMLDITKHERAGKRNQTITEWMKEDKEMDERIANAVVPNASCVNCGNKRMQEESRDLMNKKDNHTKSVLFMLTCDACSKKQAYWEDGDLWVYDPRCVKCNKSVTVIDDDKDQLLVSIYKCTHCGHEEYIEIDLSEKKEDEKDREDEKEYERLRPHCCLPESEGEEYLRSMERWNELAKDTKEREKQKDLYDAVEKLKRLKVSELEKVIDDISKKNGYDHLNFLAPEIGRNIVIPFTVQDNKSDREEYDSRQSLTKAIREILKDTNWRLMSDGITYRMGILQGRLRGYEREEDLVKLMKNDLKSNS